MKGSSRSYRSLGVESVCVLVYVPITSFIAMSIKHKGDRECVCVCGGGIWWSAYLLLTMLPLREEHISVRTHTLSATTEESSLALCSAEILSSPSIRATGRWMGVTLNPFPVCLL